MKSEIDSPSRHMGTIPTAYKGRPWFVRPPGPPCRGSHKADNMIFVMASASCDSFEILCLVSKDPPA